MRLRHTSSLAKTLAFAVVHLAIAVTLGWLLTGSFVYAGLLALVEPVLNTAVGHQLERARWFDRCARPALARSAVLGVSHLVVAVSVGWALTGSLAIAGVYAFIEPAANAVAYYFFQRWWDRAPRAAAGATA